MFYEKQSDLDLVHIATAIGSVAIETFYGGTDQFFPRVARPKHYQHQEPACSLFVLFFTFVLFFCITSRSCLPDHSAWNAITLMGERTCTRERKKREEDKCRRRDSRFKEKKREKE